MILSVLAVENQG